MAQAAGQVGDSSASVMGAVDMMWMRSPDFSGWLVKRGFRWRKLWKRRWIVLNGKDLAYMSEHPDSEQDIDALQITKIELTSDMVIEEEDVDGHPFGFILQPGCEQPTWYLRASSQTEKQEWLNRLLKVQSILKLFGNYEKGRLLGVGGSGVVYEYVNKKTGTRHALKEIEIQNKAMKNLAVAEAMTLKQVSETVTHPNILRIEKVFELGNKFYLMFPLCTGGELYERVIKRGRFSEADASKYIGQLASALKALHDHNILHLDIKPENILFENDDPDAAIKLTDFGLARALKPDEQIPPSASATLETHDDGTPFPTEEGGNRMFFEAGIIQRERLRGTVGYMAPEVIMKQQYTAAADVWAVGVVLYILLVGYPPFHSMSARDILEKTCKGVFNMSGPDWESISEPAKDLVRRLLCVNPTQRLTVDQLLAHEWIHGSAAPESHMGGAHDRMRRYVSHIRTMKLAMTVTRLMSHLRGQKLDLNVLLGINEPFEQEEDEASAGMEIQNFVMTTFAALGDGAKFTYEEMGEVFSQIDPAHQFPIQLLCRFIDRDKDGFITADDINGTHAMVLNRTEEFVRAIFRLYTESGWYFGKFANSMSRAFAGGKPLRAAAPRVVDVVEPPKYVTRRNFVAVFEHSNYGGEVGGRIFDVLSAIVREDARDSNSTDDNDDRSANVSADYSYPDSAGHIPELIREVVEEGPTDFSPPKESEAKEETEVFSSHSPPKPRSRSRDSRDCMSFLEFKKAVDLAPVLLQVVISPQRQRMLEAIKSGVLQRELQRIGLSHLQEQGRSQSSDHI